MKDYQSLFEDVLNDLFNYETFCFNVDVEEVSEAELNEIHNGYTAIEERLYRLWHDFIDTYLDAIKRALRHVHAQPTLDDALETKLLTRYARVNDCKERIAAVSSIKILINKNMVLDYYETCRIFEPNSNAIL